MKTVEVVKYTPIAAPYFPEQVQSSVVAYNTETNGIEEGFENDDEGEKEKEKKQVSKQVNIIFSNYVF